jgi:GTPase SAR1 family protein
MSGPGADTSSSTGRLSFEGKIVLVGDSFAGKTSIMAVIARGECGSATRPSIGASFAKAVVSLPAGADGPAIDLSIALWDTAGTEKFRSLNTLYYRGAAAAVVVFDLTSRASFLAVHGWVYGVHDGRLRDLAATVTGADEAEAVLRAAIEEVKTRKERA